MGAADRGVVLAAPVSREEPLGHRTKRVLLLGLLPLLVSAASRAPAKGTPAPAKSAAPSPAKSKPTPAKGGHEPAPPPKAEVTLTDVEVQKKDASRSLAEQFLQSLAHQSGDQGLSTLLGGPTLVSRIFTIDNWKVVGREKHKVEVGELASTRALLTAFDKDHRRALGELVSEAPAAHVAGDVGMGAMNDVDAAWTFELVRAKSKTFQESNPVFSFLAAVDRFEQPYVYDPFRRLLARAGWTGKYTAELDQFWIETREGHHEDKMTRRWPLYVLRFKTPRVDSGLKILPTNDSTGASAAEVTR